MTAPSTDEHDQFRQVVRNFVAKAVNPHIPAWEETGMMQLHELFAAMATLGFLGLEYDPSYGGQGADHLFTLILSEELGRCDHGALTMALGVQVDMATPRCTSPPFPCARIAGHPSIRAQETAVVSGRARSRSR